MSKGEVNLCNPESISQYLNSFAKNAVEPGQVQNYLRIALEGPLKKDPRYLVKLDTLPPNAAPWLREKWDQSIFHEFKPTGVLDQQVAHICDWIKACIERQEPWLSYLDAQGRPLKLLKLGSLEQALNEAEKDRVRQRQKHQKLSKANAAFDYEIEHGDIEIVMEFEDGYKVVRILNKVAAARESFLMQHCLADGAYDRDFIEQNPLSAYCFYSLRDPQNKPHVTWEVHEASEKWILQCVGKQNKPPVPKYMTKILEFAEARKLGYSNSSLWPGFLLKDGVLWSVESLPDNFEFEGDIDIRGLQNFRCPSNLLVKGSLGMDALQRPFLRPCLKVQGRIHESYQFSPDTYKVVTHKNQFGKISSEVWYKRDVGMHRADGPACVDYHPQTGNVLVEKWYFNAVLHRIGGPAVQSWDSISRRCIGQSWYLHGKYQDRSKIA